MISTRTIWIWRLIAIGILVLFAILMWNLYADLRRLSSSPGDPPAAESTPETGEGS